MLCRSPAAILCGSSLALGLVAPVFSQSPENFEVAPPRKASEVLPVELVKTELWRVQDGVTSFDSLNEFKIETPWGQFEAYGEPMLRIRLRELTALANIESYSTGEVFGASAKRAATESFKDAGEIVAHPIKGVGRLFKKVTYDVAELGRDVKSLASKKKGAEATGTGAEGAGKYAKRYLGIEKAERRWARKLGIDPYTTNPLLQKELSRVAKIDASAAVGTKMLAPMPSLKGVSELSRVNDLVWELDPRELYDINYKRLLEIGVPSEMALQLFDNEAFPLGHKTLFVAALMDLGGVEDRPLVVQQAVHLESEAESVFFIECVVMAAWFHAAQTPLERMVPGTLIPVGLATDGRLVAFSAADWAYWTEYSAPRSIEFSEIYSSDFDQREIWLSGRVSPLFLQGAQALGWTVRAETRKEILPRIPWGLETELVEKENKEPK